MDFLKENVILVVSNNQKKKMLLKLSEEKQLKNIKFMTLKNLITSLTFDYDEKAIAYLMDNYNLKYSNALMYLKNIKYVEDKLYNNEKLDKLVKIENDLKPYLIYDNLFSKVIKNKKIVILNKDYINKYERNILNKINNVEIINEEKSSYIHDVYEFNSINDEIEFVSIKICELINSNIDINKIKIINVNNDYLYYIKYIFDMHNIPINITNESSIYETNMVKNFLHLFDNDKNILELNYNQNDDEEVYIFNKIIEVLNKYNFKTKKETKREMIINDLKNIKPKLNKYKNAVEIVNIDEIDDEDYVFMLNFNQETIPKIYKDEDYLSDKLKDIVGIEKSFELNKIERENIINKIKSIKNLTITYKLKTSFSSFYPSSLIKDLNYNVIKIQNIDNNYSNFYNKVKLTNKLDNYVKYGDKSDNLEKLYSTYNINYLTYSNKFNGINKEHLKEYLNNNINLSYTSMNNYYECKFKYYISNVLKIKENEETFAKFIGNLFHYILSICFNKDFEFELEFKKYTQDYDLTTSNKFFLKKLKEELKFIIKTIEKQYSFSNFKDAYYENEIVVTNEIGNVKINFKGFIDKLMYKKDGNKTLLVIIDYKTGINEINLSNSIYGLNLQLPVYLYLAKHSNKIENAKVIGFYLQKILNSEISIKENKTYERQKEENLKLQGYSIDDENLIYEFDKTYKDSSVVKSMKISSEGFSRYTKILNEDMMEKLSDLVENKINDASNGIINADFKINPKKIGFKNVSCNFCKYKDICFVKENDIEILEENKDLDFLK